jgi:hypothetical protein
MQIMYDTPVSIYEQKMRAKKLVSEYGRIK